MDKRGSGWELVGALVALVTALLTVAGKPETKDYISYWSAGKLLAQHADPYSPAQVLALEQVHGYSMPRPLVMRNPPPSLFLAMPLGWMSPRAGLALWVVVAFACMAAALSLLRVPPRWRGIAYCFTPFLICIITGQSSCFLLLGVAAFLAWHRSRPWLAGAALVLVASKPHVLFLLWPLLLVDCLVKRKFKLLAGCVLGLAAASTVAAIVDPHVWTQYRAMLHAEAIDKNFLSTPAFMLRYALDVNKVWLQLVPGILGLVWAAWFYVRNRRAWDWSVHLAAVMFVSVWTCPYVWLTDEVALLPALLLAVACASANKHVAGLLVLLSATPFVMLMMKISLPTGAYTWTSSAWFVWYLYARGWRVLAEPVDRMAERRTRSEQLVRPRT